MTTSRLTLRHGLVLLAIATVAGGLGATTAPSRGFLTPVTKRAAAPVPSPSLQAIASTVRQAAAAGTPGPKPAPRIPRSVVVGAFKPETVGLIDRFQVAVPAYRGAIGTFVVNVHWADLQPVPGGPIVANNAIDQAIATAQADGLTLKIRLFAGEYAPTWAKSIGGPPLSNGTVTIGRWWTPAYESAYAQLESRLAARYDRVPQLKDVTISGCMTQYAEPLLKNDFDAGSGLAAIQAAGYTTAQDVACQQAAMVAAKAWRTTHQSFSFNPYNDGITLPNTGGEAITESLMNYCRAKLGTQCTLENNSIRTPAIGSFYTPMYAHMKALGGPIVFQTAALSRVGNLTATLTWAVKQGACAVELPSGYGSTAAPVQLAAIAPR